jgi:hypothetical protein
MGNYQEVPERPLRDEGVPPVPRAGYKAGAEDQGELASRKNDLLNTGTIGYVPGNSGTGRHSSMRGGSVEERPSGKGGGPVQYGVIRSASRKPMPREIPVHAQTTRFGNVTRYLDGHSEIHRERPGLVEIMNHPSTHPDDKELLRQEIAHRDAINTHRYR